GVHPVEGAPREAQEQLVEMVLVVRGELRDHLGELAEDVVGGEPQPVAPHGVDGSATRALGEIRGGEKGVVDVEEDRLEAHGRTSSYPNEAPSIKVHTAC